jgi:hypothetical protein
MRLQLPDMIANKESCAAQWYWPPDQIQLIHGERYMKKLVTLHLLIPEWAGNGFQFVRA